jgi:hypothetical protein
VRALKSRLHIARLAALFVLLGASGFAETGRDRQIRALVEAKFKPNGPGTAILVSRNGTPLHMAGYGLANINEKTLITPDSLFGNKFSRQNKAMIVSDS